MSWLVFLAASIAFLLTLLCIGLPIFVGFLVLNLAGLLLLIGPRGFGLFTNSLYETATSSPLVTVILFILMGEILFRSGAVNVLFNGVDSLVGRLRGRLYVVTLALSTVFGALCGSAVAVASMLGRSVMPQMEERGYDRKLAAGTVLAGASMAPIIPPSVFAIIIGTQADVSIAGLLVGGIMPGLMFAALTTAYVFLRLGRETVPERAAKQSPKLLALVTMLPFLLLIFAVTGLILLGVTTPTESAATGVLGAIVVAVLYGQLNWRMLCQSVASALTTGVVLLVIVCTAMLFSQLLSLAGATTGLVRFVGQLSLGPNATFFVLMLIPLVMCMFIDEVSFMLLAIPIYQPIVTAMGYDPVWFWMLFLINLTVGSITPPLGYTLFALRKVYERMPISEVFAAAWPVCAIFIVGMAILWAFPPIVTFLPGQLR